MRGYHRRRGWASWHTAYAFRVDPKLFPQLHELTGERPPPPRIMSGDEIARNMAAFAQAHNAALDPVSVPETPE